MLKKSKLYFSLMLTALVAISLLFSTSVFACEEEPQTFLSLYMNSDLIVLAKYDSNGKPVKSNEDEYGYTLDTDRNLLVKKVYKGQDVKKVSFLYTDYVSKETAATIEDDSHGGEHYFDLSQIKVGNEYLFFLTKDKETGKYFVTDFMSGVKETDKHLAFYEQNMGELKQIASAKANQYELLTEWIVKSIENETSREDGIADLSESFYGLSYQDQDPIYKGKGPFVVNDGYGVYTVGVAKRLTQSQKERVSKVLYPMLETAWGAEKPQYANFGIPAILSGIDKSRIVLYAHDSLQKVGKNDPERSRVIMEFLNEAMGDETYSNIYYDIMEIEYKIEEAQKDNSPQGKKAVKELTAAKDAKLVELEKRFKFMQDRKFVAVAGKVS
jgi:hypothetical protein